MKETSDAIHYSVFGSTTVADTSVTGIGRFANPKLIFNRNTKKAALCWVAFFRECQYLAPSPLILVNGRLTSRFMHQLVPLDTRRGWRGCCNPAFLSCLPVNN